MAVVMRVSVAVMVVAVGVAATRGTAGGDAPAEFVMDVRMVVQERRPGRSQQVADEGQTAGDSKLVPVKEHNRTQVCETLHGLPCITANHKRTIRITAIRSRSLDLNRKLIAI